jgi:FkbM family methyltransferase
LTLIPWPKITLPPVKTVLGSSTSILLVPHLGEFDFFALFQSRLRYEREVFTLLNERIGEFDAVLEIGANVGIFTLFFAKRLAARGRPAQIFAFEPAREAYARLYHNLVLNGLTDVQIFNCAVGECNGFATFFEPQGHLTNGSLSQIFAAYFSPTVQTTTVPMVSGETAVGLLPQTGRILIKIDVEGAEAQVLSSLKDFLVERRPTLLIEVLSVQEEMLNRLTFLHDCYTLYSITDRGLAVHEQFVAGPFRDYLLEPKASVDKRIMIRSECASPTAPTQ